MRLVPGCPQPERRRRALGTAAVAASVAGLAVLGVAEHMVRRITRPERRLHYQFHTYTPWELGLPWRDVTIPASGALLDGWLIPAGDTGAPVIVLLAGHGGSKGDLLGIARYLWQASFSLLLFDYRGTGTSAGSGSTLGYRETSDTLDAIDWVAAQMPDSPIGLLGYSMGGAVAIRAAARDQRVGAVVSDSGFASQRGVVGHVAKRTLHLPARPFMVVADRMLGLRQGFRFADVKPLREIGRLAPRPLFIIHGEQDDIVPVAQAYELYAAAGEPKRLWIVGGAPHVGAYFVDRPRYCREVAAFFNEALGRPSERTAEGNGSPSGPAQR